MNKRLNETSEIGKTSVHISPAGPTDQEVISLSLDNVINTVGEYIVCLFKDYEHTMKSSVDKTEELNCPIDKTSMIDSPINKVAVYITETNKMKIVKSFINQTQYLSSRIGNLLITNSMLEKQYENGSLINQTLVIKSQIKKEVIGG